MRFSAVVATLLPVGAAFAATHPVMVGGQGQNIFTPNQLMNVANGDVIQFQFLDKNHTVTQSTFAAPCSNITDATGAVTGVDSGYQFVPANATQFPVWQITVNNASAPLWFYCRQGKHCQSGMVFAVNPTAQKSFSAFQTNAGQSTAVNGSPAPGASGAPAPPAGGVSGAPGPSASAVGPSGSAGAPTPSASNKPGNGAGMLSVSGTTILSAAGLALGLLL